MRASGASPDFGRVVHANETVFCAALKMSPFREHFLSPQQVSLNSKPSIKSDLSSRLVRNYTINLKKFY